MVVVSIVGVLATLASYGVRKYVARAKAAEAINAVGRVAKDAAAAYTRDGMSGSVSAAGISAPVSHNLCAGVGTGETVPSNAAAIRGSRYQSRPTDWTQGTASQGWRCLRFSIEQPQYYMYNYSSPGGGARGTTFEASAQGDLDGDGTLSNFALRGQLAGAAASILDVMIAPNLVETNPDE